MAKGSCLCGAIAFEFDNAGVVIAVGCYCTNCRKVSGSGGAKAGRRLNERPHLARVDGPSRKEQR